MKTLQLLFACVAIHLPPMVTAQITHAFLWTNEGGMQDLGTLGGDNSFATGTNNLGQVVGSSYLADNVTLHAFLWTASSGMIDLGTPGGASSSAVAINSLGHVIGSGTKADESGTVFWWSPQRGFVLPRAHSPRISLVFGLNDFDQVTGQGSSSAGGPFACVWLPLLGKTHNLGTYPFGSFSGGKAINNLKHVAGFGDTGSLFIFALQWDHPAGWQLLGGVGGEFGTLPLSNNDNDEVVGFGMEIFSFNKAFYYSGATGIVVLQALVFGEDAAANAINEDGTIAGFSKDASGASHAVVWADYTSTPQDLGTLPGGTFANATAINDLAQVVGNSETR